MEKKPLIIAHRGESHDAPENTLSSVNLAWERGADAVEIDVRLSKDNHVVVIHDKDTRRTGNRSEKVKEQSLNKLRQLDVGSWKAEKFKGEKIPTLNEIFQTVLKGKKLIIEIKSSEKIIPSLINDIEESYLESNQIEIISFNYDVIKKIKQFLPSYKALYLVDLDYTWMTKVFSPPVEKLIEKVKSAQLDGLNVWAGKLLTEEFVHKVKSAGLILYVWTVNNPFHAQKLIYWGIDGITTDRAQWMKQKLE